MVSNFFGRRAGWEGYGGADADGDFPKVGEAAVLAFHLPYAVGTHRNDGDAKIFCEESDAALKWSPVAVFGVSRVAFGKNEHAAATFDGFEGEAEPFVDDGNRRV